MGYFASALVAAVVIGAGSGLVGVLVVLRRRVFFAQALTHATFPGAVVAALVGFSVPLGAALASVAIVGIMGLITRVKRQGGQVAAGIVLTTGFALGAILQAVNPEVPLHLESFLVGSILSVTTGDIVLSTSVLVVAVAAIALFGKELIFQTFDPRGFTAAGYRAWPVELLALALITATVVTAMPAVGAILAIALIAAPAAAARLVAPSVGWMLVVSPLIGAASGVLGVLFSRLLDVAAGPAIALAAAAFFLVALLVRRMPRLGLREEVTAA
ncbi:metal ABC transporter permease [Glaciibacter flavus]|uniref:metal ABC transporter permease n=1 Tax=Orlajensenia flava TaxID=2565934 RepID=UPI003AFF76B3